MNEQVRNILAENNKRKQAIQATYNPFTGEGAILERFKCYISDFPIPTQYLPIQMRKVALVKQLMKAGSIKSFLEKLGTENTKEEREKVVTSFIRVRNNHDFCFWAALDAFIKNKGGGEDIRFILNRAQRVLIERLERMRLAGSPIRLILLKARQWGGSTAVQIYMAWLQLVHRKGLNSLIVGHVKDASTEVKEMFNRLIERYPIELLYKPFSAFNHKDPKIVGVGASGNIHHIPQRNCNIKIGTAEKPDSARGGDYNLVHCTEVGLWKTTEGKTPEQIVRSATSGVLYRPYTMIVYESTANGTGNFFQREYDAAKNGKSQFEALFIPWFIIDLYSLPIKDEEEFATNLYVNRDNEYAPSEREENGKYLYWLFEQGATLEAINWYIQERKKFTDHADMASEYPSDDIEAFAHSGARVFDRYHVEAFRKYCKPPVYVGDLYANARQGREALQNIKFTQDNKGLLTIWALPEIDPTERVTDRYLVSVDIGGRSSKADYSVICVFDRLFMIDGGVPSVVAQWYGHIDMHLLAWKAAQIASFYDNALLVIESNTLETKDKDRFTEGDSSSYILHLIRDVYPNLYARRQSPEEIAEQAPKKYGFHTNIKTKGEIIDDLKRIIPERLYLERDERCLDEYLTYEQKQNGAYGAIPGKHDDLLMSRAIGLWICFHEMPRPRIITKTSNVIRRRKKPASEASL
jgi:hypothetical protein